MSSNTASESGHIMNKPYGALVTDNNTPAMEGTPLLEPLSEERKHELALRRQAKQTSVMSKIIDGKSAASKKAKPPPQQQQQQRQVQQQHTHHRSWLYTLLNSHSKKPQAIFFKRFISSVIILDLIVFIISTDDRIGDAHPKLFHIAEGVSSSIFLVEFLCRLITITESHKYCHQGPWAARWAFVSTSAAAIDLLSTVPFFLELGTGWNLPTLTYLRLFRLLRILRTEGYVRAVDAIFRVIYFNSEILYVAALLCIFLILVTAVLLYYFQPANEEDAEDFASIAATLYMSTLMLTGQGGPEGNLPWYTKCIVLLTSVFSVAMFAIPASMLTWGFEAEAERMARQARRRAMTRLKEADSNPHPAPSSDETESDDCDSTDEEYFRIIAGEDEEDADASNDTPWMREMRQKFLEADDNMDGTLTLHEFFEMQSSIVNAPPPPASMANASLVSRMQALERKVAANAEKLDQILNALQKKK